MKVGRIILENLLFIPDLLHAKKGGAKSPGERAALAVSLADDSEPFLITPAVQKRPAKLGDDIVTVRLQILVEGGFGSIPIRFFLLDF